MKCFAFVERNNKILLFCGLEYVIGLSRTIKNNGCFHKELLDKLVRKVRLKETSIDNTLIINVAKNASILK